MPSAGGQHAVMADSEDRAVASPGSTSSQLVASDVLEARYRQVMRVCLF